VPPDLPVVIQRSSAIQIAHLVASLAGGGKAASAARDAAVARLRVIGARAVPHLLDTWKSTPDARVRVAVLQALDGHDDPRVTSLVLEGLADPEADVRAAAANSARWLLEGARGAEVLDRLTTVALDTTERAPVRVAAIAALQDLPGRLIAPVRARLTEDPDPAVRAASAAEITPDDTPQGLLVDAAAGRLPNDPQLVCQALAAAGAGLPLPTLHRLVTIVRDRERASDAAGAADWRSVRGAAHVALALRGSRVAAYDLRETVREATAPLPDDFLRALGEIGDADALDDLAAALSRASGAPHGPWALALRRTARTIALRERLTARHAALKRLHARWGQVAATLLSP
jgi:HEAT repeat protein